MNTIEIRKISITDLDSDAIVNAANEQLVPGGGVCGAIFKAAGYKELQSACMSIGYCKTGSAVATSGYKLNAKYIIHAVGPRWIDGKHGERESLYNAYQSSLNLALQHHCKSIGFPLISAGIYGYPVREAWYTAFGACRDFLRKNPKADLTITFAVLDDEIKKIGHKALLGSGASVFKIAEKVDYKNDPMPDQHEVFILKREFSSVQMAILKRGHIPQEMEDKWFWFVENNKMRLCRSWTGFCIYEIEFRPDNCHIVTVNRNPEQYKCTSVEEDIQSLNKLLNWMIHSEYNYYQEWLSETVDGLQKSGQIKDNLIVSGQTFDAVYFHLPTEPHGYLSNWYPSRINLEGEAFSSAEQYIMYKKCQMFGDQASAAKVLQTDDPAQQQDIGRKASGYDNNVWAGARQMIAYEVLLAKFTQNEDLKKKLLETGDAYLVECAGSDKIWACGIKLYDDDRKNASNWTGQNILGFTLMKVREHLRN